VNSTTGRPCCLAGCPSDEERRQCIQELFHNLAMPLGEPALTFRDSHCRAARPLIDRAHSLVFPSAAAEAIFRAQAGALPAASRVIPHGYDARPLGPRPDREDVRMQVAFLGEIAYRRRERTTSCRCCGEPADRAVWHVFGNVGTFGFEKGSSASASATTDAVPTSEAIRRSAPPWERRVFAGRARDLPSPCPALTAGVPVIVNRFQCARSGELGRGPVVDGVTPRRRYRGSFTSAGS
jgi:hypothetical protein